MKLEIYDHHTERHYVLEGTLDEVKNQLVQRFPFMEEPLFHLDIYQCVKYLNQQQSLSAHLDYTDEERESIPTNEPQSPINFWPDEDEENVNDSNALEGEIDGIEPLPENLHDLWLED